MAQETKIGLIVGLGFIICFASVLANRGGGDRIRQQLPHRLFETAEGLSPAQPPGTPEVSAQVIGRERRPALSADASELTPVQSPAEREVVTESSEQAAEPRITPPIDPERFTRRRHHIPKPLLPADSAVAAADDADTGTARLLTGVTAPAPDALAKGLTPQPQTVPLPAETPNEAPAVASNLPPGLEPYADQLERVSPQSSSPTGSELRHVVQRGDTLSRIALRYYRSSSAEIVDALFEANHALLRSRDAVLAGTELRLPVLEGVTPHAAPDMPPADLAPKEALADATPAETTDEPPLYRLYRVQKGDLLGTIALEQLGTSHRWREILKLNPNVCPDEHHLPWGVEIRIPLDVLADAR
ncbi:MAG: LysM peptidoglycan-binding domain-containing protein [bacterium]|nr:LysM peptidoglycan-binding domain-containing protein [bacterium]